MYNPMGIQSEDEYEAFEADAFEYEGEWETEIGLESPFSEAEEMELASQLLEITDEAELDQFLGKLVKKAWRGIRKVSRSVIRPLGGALKAVAKTALPFVGGALGSLIPIPGVGTAVGTALGGALSKALEMEFEGLSDEDQEFEMARRYVRLAGAAARQAAMTPPGVAPSVAVRNALITAARRQVPHLANSGVTGSKNGSGRWVRRGKAIILLGI